MTGAFIRIKRNNEWDNIEIDQMTDEELDQLEKDQGIDRGWLWAKFLAKWIRDNVTEVGPIGGG